jgi:F-type H+-transporting ATPase subunit a
MIDPIEQFQIHKLVPIAKIGSLDIAFTNSALYMVLAVVAISLFLLLSTSSQALIPGRMQATAEVFYEFIADMVQTTTGSTGMMFFPFVFSLFMFILFANVVGLIPFAFTVTSQLVITVALSLLVFVTVIVVGFLRNGLHFLRIFVPKGVPLAVLIFVVPIEVFSFFVRPVSHSIRLFANMLAGHITMQVFAGFVIMLGAAGFVGVLGALMPLVMTVALFALELLVAVLQAYVFAILTCIYLNDALHPGH